MHIQRNNTGLQILNIEQCKQTNSNQLLFCFVHFHPFVIVIYSYMYLWFSIKVTAPGSATIKYSVYKVQRNTLQHCDAQLHSASLRYFMNFLKIPFRKTMLACQKLDKYNKYHFIEMNMKL